MKEIQGESSGEGANISWDLMCISKNTTFFLKKKKRRNKHRGSPKNFVSCGTGYGERG